MQWSPEDHAGRRTHGRRPVVMPRRMDGGGGAALAGRGLRASVGTDEWLGGQD
ncbi:hypothetical protein [Acidovorax sp. Root275]|uniref:hypothetical protein n=1 Tax=Acidovorax sp. Root275 TaxID=1736508 RepID=UPI0013014577|nr:hypothetical protein [Acidovorax sp. Root275]